jgi:hypothetical protein
MTKKLNNEWRISRKPPFGPRRMQPDVVRSDDYADTATSASSPPIFSNTTPPESPVVFGSSLLSGQGAVLQPTTQDIYMPSRLDPHLNPASYQLVPIQAQSQHDTVHEIVKDLLRTLSQRGTGQHICPYGRACTKGGIENGALRVFERNSAFRFVYLSSI